MEKRFHLNSGGEETTTPRRHLARAAYLGFIVTLSRVQADMDRSPRRLWSSRSQHAKAPCEPG